MKQINKISKVKSLLWWQGNNWKLEIRNWVANCQQFTISKFGLSFLCLLLIAHHSSLIAQSQKLSENAKVSLITIGPGKELYSVFGHAGIWVSDPVNGIDKVYSYGTFDFNTDNFYVKFVRGTLPYQISYATLQQNVDFYRQENRSVTENVIQLTPLQRQRLYDSLEVNYRPENREYRYKFFYDNCATRLRDKVMMSIKDSLNYLPVKELNKKSYREWMNKYLDEKPWARFGMNLAIGQPSDKVATQEESMYLPDNLALAFKESRTLTNHHIRHLISEIHPLVVATPVSDATPFWLSPWFIFTCLFVWMTYLTYSHWKSKMSGFWIDRWFFGALGVVGWLLFFLWVFTDHGVTTENYSLLWALPIHIPVILLMQERHRPSWHWLYFLAVTITAAVGMLMCQYIVQDLLPLLGCIFVRGVYHFALERHRRRFISGKWRM